MAANPQREPRYTVEEYFELESKSELRHEYIDGEIVALAGGDARHYTLSGNLAITLGVQARGKGCRGFTSDTAIKLHAGHYAYPDYAVVCVTPDYERWKQQGIDVLVNPTLLIEILSPSTEVYDRGRKFYLYQGIASLQEYVLISQDKPLIEHYVRQPDGKWLYDSAHGLEAALELRSVGCVLALADVYADVEFAGEGSDAASADVEFAGEGSDAASADVEFDDQTGEA